MLYYNHNKKKGMIFLLDVFYFEDESYRCGMIGERLEDEGYQLDVGSMSGYHQEFIVVYDGNTFLINEEWYTTEDGYVHLATIKKWSHAKEQFLDYEVVEGFSENFND